MGYMELRSRAMHEPNHGAMPQASSHMVKDPVCGMNVDPHTAAHKAEQAGGSLEHD